MGQSFDIQQMTAWQNADLQQQPVADRESTWSPEKRYLMKTLRRIRERGGTEDDIYSYLQHYEKLPTSVKNRMAGITVNAPEPVETPGKVRGASMHALQGITFGLGDESVGALLGAITGKGWREGIDEYRKELEAFAEEHRALALTSDIAGGFVGFGAARGLLRAGGAGLRAAGLTRAAGAVDKAVDVGRAALAPTKSVGKKLATAAGLGAAGGAARGFGEGEGGPLDRAGSTAIGGAAGFMLGPPLVLLGAGIVKGSTPIVRFLSKNASAAAERLGVHIPSVFSAEQQARTLFVRRLAEDGIDLQVLMNDAALATKTGQPVVLADLLANRGAYRTLAMLDDAVKVRDPRLQQTLQQAEELLSRTQGAGDRIKGFVFDRVLRGTKLGTMSLGDAQDALMAKARSQSAPLYDKAYGDIVDVGTALRDRFKGPYGEVWKSAYERARTRLLSEMETEGVRVPGGKVPKLKEVLGKKAKLPAVIKQMVSQWQAAGFTEKEIAEKLALHGFDQAVKTETEIPLRLLDYLKREINFSVRDAYKSLAPTETQTSIRAGKEQIAKQLQQFVEDVIDPQSSAYKGARAVFAGPVETVKAGESGLSAYNSRMDGKVIAKKLAEFGTDAEREQFRLGYLQGAADDINKSNGKAVNFAQTIFGGNTGKIEGTRTGAIRALFPKRADADEVIEYLHREARLYETAARFGKRPAATLEEAATDLGEGSILPQGVTGGVSIGRRGMPTGFIRGVSTALRAAKRPFVREVGNAVSSMMLKGATNPGELEAFLWTIMPMRSRALQTQIAGRAAGGVTAGQQAQQFQADPMGAAMGVVQAGVGGLSRLFSMLGGR